MLEPKLNPVSPPKKIEAKEKGGCVCAFVCCVCGGGGGVRLTSGAGSRAANLGPDGENGA